MLQTMSNESKSEYLSKIKPRYQKASKLEKEKILDEFCSVCEYNRKYAIRKLNAKDPPKNKYEYRKRGPSIINVDYLPLNRELFSKIYLHKNKPMGSIKIRFP